MPDRLSPAYFFNQAARLQSVDYPTAVHAPDGFNALASYRLAISDNNQAFQSRRRKLAAGLRPYKALDKRGRFRGRNQLHLLVVAINPQTAPLAFVVAVEGFDQLFQPARFYF